MFLSYGDYLKELSEKMHHMHNTFESLQKARMNRQQHLFAKEKKSGFFDLPKSVTCRHPEHKQPTHIYIPQGQGYRHVCPGCGQIHDIIPPQISF